MSSAVLDASAFLAFLREEPGADVVEAVIGDGAAISTANLAEVLSHIADRGGNPQRAARQLTEQGLLHGAIAVEPMTAEDAIEIARLRPLTRAHGLSLGDRACVALAQRLGASAVTADSAWSRADLDVDVRRIR
jgi:ribonuclease VapC